MNFQYEVLNQNGESKKGTIEAEDKVEAVDELEKNDYYIIEIKEKTGFLEGTALGNILNLNLNISFGGDVKNEDLVFLAQQFKFLLNSGLTLIDSIDILRNQLENESLSDSLGEIKELLAQGESFYEALSRFPKIYPIYFRKMIKIGEQTGTLENTFGNLMDFYTYKDETNKTVKSAMYYPAFIVGIAIVAFFFISLFVIPKFQEMFGKMGIELPTITKVVLKGSQFINNNIVLIIVSIISLIVGLVMFSKTKMGKRALGTFLLNFPLTKEIYVKINMFQLSLIISDTLNSGSTLVNSLSLAEEINTNYYYKERIADALQKIKEGQTLYGALKNNDKHFKSMFLEMVNVGEEVGQLENTLGNLSRYYMKAVIQETEALTSLIEPIMIVLMGLVVGFMVAATILPTFSMSQGVM